MKITLFLISLLLLIQGALAVDVFSLTTIYSVKDSRIKSSKGLRLSMDIPDAIPVSASIDGSMLDVTLRKLDAVNTKRVRLKVPTEYLKYKFSGIVKTLATGEILLPFQGGSEEVMFPRKGAMIVGVSFFSNEGKLLVASTKGGRSGAILNIFDLRSGSISKDISLPETYDAYNGRLFWISNHLVLQSFVGLKGGAYGIIDLKDGKIVKSGGYSTVDNLICVAGGKVIILSDRLSGVASKEIFK
jgi:hypothetical protein